MGVPLWVLMVAFVRILDRELCCGFAMARDTNCATERDCALWRRTWRYRLWPPCPVPRRKSAIASLGATTPSAMPTVGMPRHARSLGPALSQSVRHPRDEGHGPSRPSTRLRAQRLPGAAHRGRWAMTRKLRPGRARVGQRCKQQHHKQHARCVQHASPPHAEREGSCDKRTRTNKTVLSLDPRAFQSPPLARQRSTAPAHMDLLGQLLPKSDTSSAGYAHMCKLWVSGIGGCLPISCPLRFGRASPSLCPVCGAPRGTLRPHAKTCRCTVRLLRMKPRRQALPLSTQAGRTARRVAPLLSRQVDAQGQRRAARPRASKSAGGACSHSLASSSNGTTRSALTDEMNEDELRATIEQSLAVLEKTVEQASMEKALLVSLYVGTGCQCGVCTPALISRGTGQHRVD